MVLAMEERRMVAVGGDMPRKGFVVAGILHTGFAVGEDRKGLAEVEHHMALVVDHIQSMDPGWSSDSRYFSLLKLILKRALYRLYE